MVSCSHKQRVELLQPKKSCQALVAESIRHVPHKRLINPFPTFIPRSLRRVSPSDVLHLFWSLMHLVVSYANYLPFLVNIWLSVHVAWRNMKFSADKSDHLGSRLPWRYGLLWSDDISRLAWNWLYLHCPLESILPDVPLQIIYCQYCTLGSLVNLQVQSHLMVLLYLPVSGLTSPEHKGVFSYILSGSRC